MKVFKHTVLIATICFSMQLHQLHAQNLHTNGKYIVNGDGEEVILRGMGLGGWMLQEGYMLQTGSFAGPQYKIRQKIKDLIGEDDTKAFYDAWLSNHCTKQDIDSLAAWGFNSVRLPMHYNLFTLPIEEEPIAGENTWLEKGFAMTDSLLKWCEANQLYLILDLHAAPGGQGNDANISDYDTTKPSLWESEANKLKTIALWKKLAERYVNEEWIGGYDLINEPNWNFVEGGHPNGCDEESNAPLRKLYLDITEAIRSVDQNHIIFIEGNCWGNNYKGIFPKWDSNMVVSFHKYWNYNTTEAIQYALDIREENNLPIWLGESGENSNTWFTDAIRLMESNNIGWAWWPLKKVGSIVNPLTIKKTDGYTTLLKYWEKGGAKPTVEFSRNTLMELAANTHIQNTIYRPDVIDAMFRQVHESGTKPYSQNNVPGVIFATDFDLGGNGIAYWDSDTANYWVSSGERSAWNSGYSYRNDGVDIEACSDTDPGSNHYNIGWTKDGEWLNYTLNVNATGVYDIVIRYAMANGPSTIAVKINGADVAFSKTLTSTGGDQKWKNIKVGSVHLAKGSQTFTLLFEKGGANIGFIKFSPKK